MVSVHWAPLLLKKVRGRSKHSYTSCWLRGWTHGGAPQSRFNCLSESNCAFTEPKAPSPKHHAFLHFSSLHQMPLLFSLATTPNVDLGQCSQCQSPNSPWGDTHLPPALIYITWPHLTITQALLTLMSTFSTHKSHIYWATYGDSYPLKVYSLKEEMLIWVRIKSTKGGSGMVFFSFKQSRAKGKATWD